MQNSLSSNIAKKLRKLAEFCARKPVLAFYIILSLLILITILFYLICSNFLWDDLGQPALNARKSFKQKKYEEVFTVFSEREKEFNESDAKRYPDLFMDLTNK